MRFSDPTQPVPAPQCTLNECLGETGANADKRKPGEGSGAMTKHSVSLNVSEQEFEAKLNNPRRAC